MDTLFSLNSSGKLSYISASGKGTAGSVRSAVGLVKALAPSEKLVRRLREPQTQVPVC